MDDQARLWHKQNRMPCNATPQQRVAWHLEHAKHCQCRPIPDSVLALTTNQGGSSCQLTRYPLGD